MGEGDNGAMMKTEKESSICECPCDPADGCEECAGYWERMKQEGYWAGQEHRWTKKGWKEITK